MRGLGWLVMAGCGRLGFDAPAIDVDAHPTDTRPIDTQPGGTAVTSMRSLCTGTRITVINGSSMSDSAVAAQLPAAMQSGCVASPLVRTVSENDPGILDPASGRPLLAVDDIGVLAGGDATQRAMAYLQPTAAPIAVQETGNRIVLTDRATNTVVLDASKNTVGMSHDYATIEVIIEPISGAMLFSVAGVGGAGTVAGGYYFRIMLAPTLSTESATWYVIDWLDADGDPNPSAGDTFTILGSG